jgi:hypothetical protein
LAVPLWFIAPALTQDEKARLASKLRRAHPEGKRLRGQAPFPPRHSKHGLVAKDVLTMKGRRRRRPQPRGPSVQNGVSA